MDWRQGEGAGKGNEVPFNRLTSYRGLHYRYDEHGRTVEKRGRNGTQHYRWDAEHRLTEVRVIRGSTVRRYGYVYDALGRRTEKHELDADNQPYNRTTFLWDGMRLAQECRLGRRSSLYIYSDQGSYEPLARVDRAAPGEPDEVLYYHTDVNGAPEEMTDREGNIVWEAGYQVWGNLRHEKESRAVEQSLRFQGQYLDRETGLHYNLHRYFDPDVGRFLSSDPIGLAGGINLYAYAPNPLSWIDPLGLSCSFDSKSNRWRNNETGRFTKRPTDPSELVNNGRINKSDIDVWASQGGIPNTWGHDPAKFPSGGFKYDGGSYTVHGHGANPSAAAKFPNSNAAHGPTASMKNTSTGEVFRTDGSWGTFKSDPNGAHIPLDGSSY